MIANKSIRAFIEKRGVKHWQVALQLGVSEQTLVRWLRVPLTPDKEAAIRAAVDDITKEGQ